jgi:CYTH domain-containing protein
LRIEKGATPLYKKRYTFSLGALVAEIDVYPFFSDFCVMEIELPTEATVPEIPDFIRVIKEVTGEKAYSNRALAHRN